jgi:hypothetical protein
MKDIKKIQEFFSKPLNENERMSGNTLTKILDWSMVDELREKIKQINRIFPKHDVALIPHTFSEYSDDPYLKNRYTISYSGPSDEQFKKTIQTLTQKYSDNGNLNEQEDAVDTITMDVPLFLRMLEYSREDAAEDMDLHDVTEKAISLGKERGILQMEDYDEIIGGAEEIDKTKLNEEISEQNLYSSISNIIPENTNYEDLAKAIAKILKEDYGSHNFKPFITTLVNELKK